MAKKGSSNNNQWRLNKRKQITSDGSSKNSRPKNKHKKKNFKKYRGQGK